MSQQADETAKANRVNKSNYNAKYPYNKVTVTESGHEIHYDDTPGYERIRFAHKDGTYWEISSGGKKVEYVVGNHQQYNKGGVTITIDENQDMKIAGHQRLIVGGGSHIEVAGDASVVTGGDTMSVTMGNHKSSVAGDMYIGVAGEGNFNIKGNLNMKVGGDMITDVGGSQTTAVGGDTSHTSGGSNKTNASEIHHN